MFCKYCGQELPEEANFCLKCGRPLGAAPSFAMQEENRMLVWILFLFGGICGVHRFFMGGWHLRWGILYLMTCAFCGVGCIYDLLHLSAWIDDYLKQ